LRTTEDTARSSERTPGLLGVVVDQLADRLVVEGDLGVLHPVGLELLRDQVLTGDLLLLLVGVAAELDDLHAVLQRQRDRVQRVCGAQEQHVAEVVVEVEEVVDEGVVLLGVEDLEHGRRRVAAEVHRDLVDLVEQEHRVGAPGLAQTLDDLAGHGADVRAPVAADLGLVAHAAERDADELAVGGPGDALGERGLADAGRADEAEDRPLELGHQRTHREVLDDALLGLLQAVMIGVEDALGLGDVELLDGALVPRQGQHGVDVVAHDGRLGAHRAHHLELAQLLLEAVAGLGAHLAPAHPLLELGDLVLELVLTAELLLDRLHLLVEVVLLLVLLHLLLDAGTDLLLHLENLDLVLHQLVELLQAGADGLGLEQLLLGGELEVDVRRDGVGHARGVVDALHADRQLRRHALVELHVVLEGLLHRAHERRDLGLVLGADRRGSSSSASTRKYLSWSM
jgi:hypothetical protein